MKGDVYRDGKLVKMIATRNCHYCSDSNVTPFPATSIFSVLMSTWVKNDVGRGWNCPHCVAALPTTLVGHDSDPTGWVCVNVMSRK